MGCGVHRDTVQRGRVDTLSGKGAQGCRTDCACSRSCCKLREGATPAGAPASNCLARALLRRCSGPICAAGRSSRPLPARLRATVAPFPLRRVPERLAVGVLVAAHRTPRHRHVSHALACEESARPGGVDPSEGTTSHVLDLQAVRVKAEGRVEAEGRLGPGSPPADAWSPLWGSIWSKSKHVACTGQSAAQAARTQHKQLAAHHSRDAAVEGAESALSPNAALQQQTAPRACLPCPLAAACAESPA